MSLKKLAALVLLLVCASALSLFLIWLFDRTPPVRVMHPEDTRTSDVGGNERREFRSGETIRVWRGVCVDRAPEVVSTNRWLADTERKPLEDEKWNDHIDETTPVGTCASRWVVVAMPVGLSAITWKYNYERVYRINPLKTVTVRWPVVLLTIVPPAPEKDVEVLKEDVKALKKKAEEIKAPLVRQGPPGRDGRDGAPGLPGTPAPKPKRWWWE